MRTASGVLLVVTDRRFWRRSIGSEQRIASLVEHRASQGERVVVAYLGRVSSRERPALDRFCEPFGQLEVRSRAGGPAEILASLLAAGRLALSAGLRALFRRGWVDGENPLLRGSGSASARRAFVQGLLRELEPRAVIIEFLRLTPTVHPRPLGRAGVTAYLVDTHDVLHQRATRFREGGVEPALEVDARQEAEALATYDAVIAIHDGEGRTIRALVPERPVLVVPHGLALPTPAPGFAPGPRPIRLGLLAGRDESNRAGLRWFLDSVWPKLVLRFDDRIELRVAGRICETFSREEARKEARKERGMQLIGALDSIGEFWPAIDIAINPVRFGSGLKIKNVEALAYARALITSPVGAEGLESAAPAGLQIADTPDEWQGVLTHWIEDPAALAHTARQGRAYAEHHFSPSTAFRELDAYLDAHLDAHLDGHLDALPTTTPSRSAPP